MESENSMEIRICWLGNWKVTMPVKQCRYGGDDLRELCTYYSLFTLADTKKTSVTVTLVAD